MPEPRRVAQDLISEALRSGTDELSLVELGLTSIPREIGLLTKLAVLSLGGNSFTTLPAAIGQLTELEELDISECRLATLPAEIGRLKKLRILYLTHNQLVELPAEIGQLSSLRVLQLEHNLLTSLPPQIGDLANLRELRLAYNHLSVLPPEIGRLNIKPPYFPPNQKKIIDPRITLTLYGNPLIDPPPEVKGIGEVMGYLRHQLKAKERVWLEGDKLEIVAGTTLEQYRRIIQALVDDGGRIHEALEGLGDRVTVIDTRNARVSVQSDDLGNMTLECHKPEVLGYLRAFLLRNLDSLLR